MFLVEFAGFCVAVGTIAGFPVSYLVQWLGRKYVVITGILFVLVGFGLLTVAVFRIRFIQEYPYILGICFFILGKMFVFQLY